MEKTLQSSSQRRRPTLQPPHGIEGGRQTAPRSAGRQRVSERESENMALLALVEGKKKGENKGSPRSVQLTAQVKTPLQILAAVLRLPLE